MSTRKKVAYIVTSEDYSDYSIVWVFSTKDLAKEYIRITSCLDESYIEEYEVDKLKLWTSNNYIVSIKQDMTVHYTQYEKNPDVKFWKKDLSWEIFSNVNWLTMRLYITAKDMEHAQKIAIDYARANRNKMLLEYYSEENNILLTSADYERWMIGVTEEQIQNNDPFPVPATLIEG